MPSLRENSQRIKRFRELKATLRTNRARLLVGIDVAQAEHVVHVRQAHTRVVIPQLTIPNTTRGFTQLWTRIQQAQRATGCREVVCSLEPTGTYHQAVATFLETQGADVVFVSSSVAAWNRRTQDGTGDKHDRKDAAHGADLLEQGKVLFASQPTGPLADLRHLVQGLRRARTELAAGKARWRTTLRPALAPMGAALRQRLWAELPAVLQAWERAAPGRPALPKGRLPLGLAAACVDLGAQVTAVQARIGTLEAACTPLAERLPAYPPPPHDPGDRADGRGDSLGRDRRHRLVHPVQSAPQARGARHRARPVGAVRGADAHLEMRAGAPAVGAGPRPPVASRGPRPAAPGWQC